MCIMRIVVLKFDICCNSCDRLSFINLGNDFQTVYKGLSKLLAMVSTPNEIIFLFVSL